MTATGQVSGRALRAIPILKEVGISTTCAQPEAI